MIGNFSVVSNFNQLFLKLNRFICNYLPVLPDHCDRLHVVILQFSFIKLGYIL